MSASIKSQLENSDLVEYTTAEAAGMEVLQNGEILLSLKYDGQIEKVPYQYVVVATGFDALWFFDLFDQSAKIAFLQHVIDESSADQITELETTLGSAVTAVSWLTELQNPPARRALERSVEGLIDNDLSIRNFKPKLHLPMMAGLSQGPGFPNLNCLGLMSDRILKSYLLN